MTSDGMDIEAYLAQGGKLTAPGNVPARYRGELLRMLSGFVDSQLAASAGFAEVINAAPGIKPRIAAARIVLEKADHAERVLALMGEFGVDIGRYEGVHPWAARLARDADIGARREGGDMRMAVFHYPFAGWVDAVVMNVLQGQAALIQLREFERASYQPLAEVIREILPHETRHFELGREGLAQIVTRPEGREAAALSIAYWRPRVALGFGPAGSPRFARLQALGLRHHPNEELRAEWDSALDAILHDLTQS